MLSRTRFVLGLALVFAIATLVVMSGSQAQQPTGPESGGTITGLITSVPRTMSYQAILYDIAGNPVRNTTLDVTFRIYDAYTGGNELWMEVVQVTTDRNGNFTAILGENIPLNLSFDTDYWMSLQVGGDPEMVPRLKLHMVPYSARTDTSDYAFSSLSGGGWVDDGTVVRLENSTDYVGIGTTNPGANLHIAATSAGSPVKINIDAADVASAASIRFENGGGLGKAEIWYDIAGEKFTVKAISPGSVLNLWGRDNDGISVDQHGDVGIGTTSPQGALDVSSTTGAFIVPRMTTAQRNALTAVNGMIVYNTTNDQFNFYENGAWVTK